MIFLLALVPENAVALTSVGTDVAEEKSNDKQLEQFWKEYSSIFATLLGKDMLVRVVRPLKALFPMLVTVFGITVLTHPYASSLVAELIIALQLSLESKTGLFGSTDMLTIEEQFANAERPIDVREAGMFMLERESQFLKDIDPIPCKEFGNVILESEEHHLNPAPPIPIKLSGRLIEVKLEQYWNVPFPMISTLSPSSTDTKL